MDGELLFQSPQVKRKNGRNRSVSDPHGGCAPPCRCALVCKVGSACAGCPAQRLFSQTMSAGHAGCWRNGWWIQTHCQFERTLPVFLCGSTTPAACAGNPPKNRWIAPDADLVNTMLDQAIAVLPPDAKPIVHSDRGCHYRWPGWIRRMQAAGLRRSMSKKGCSPDNSACEGFFGH